MYKTQALFGDKISLVSTPPFAADLAAKPWKRAEGKLRQFSRRVVRPGSDVGVTPLRQTKRGGFLFYFSESLCGTAFPPSLTGWTHQRGHLGLGFSLWEELTPITQ